MDNFEVHIQGLSVYNISPFDNGFVCQHSCVMLFFFLSFIKYLNTRDCFIPNDFIFDV